MKIKVDTKIEKETYEAILNSMNLEGRNKSEMIRVLINRGLDNNPHQLYMITSLNRASNIKTIIKVGLSKNVALELLPSLAKDCSLIYRIEKI